MRIVQKFGGTSVGTPERIRAVADRIAATTEEGHELVVVVSAMGHTTDELITLAHEVSKTPHQREMDMLLTAGERISMALLSMALHDREVAAVSFTGSQTGIITDASHRRARIRRIRGDRVRDALNLGKVAIVAGFQGVSEEKEITTLGRGGSDTTAVALAASLRAELCEIFTDVDGVYSADPRVVPGARLWTELPGDLMLELAVRGAGVLHPRSVEFARQYGVSLKVRNSMKETGKGTTITTQALAETDAPGMEEFGIVGVTADTGKVLVSVDLSRPTVLAALWDRARQANLPVITPVFSDGKVHYFTDSDAEGEWQKHLGQLAVDGFIKGFHIDRDQIPLSIVGYRFSQDGAALQAVIELLARENILVTMGCASALAITVAIARKYADDGTRALHAEFIEKKPPAV